MLVKYVGKQDSIVAEYNGKKYAFTKTNPIREIPDEVFSFIKASNTTLSELVVPHQPQAVMDTKQHDENAKIITRLDERIAELTDENEKLKARVEKLLGKIKKSNRED